MVCLVLACLACFLAFGLEWGAVWSVNPPPKKSILIYSYPYTCVGSFLSPSIIVHVVLVAQKAPVRCGVSLCGERRLFLLLPDRYDRLIQSTTYTHIYIQNLHNKTKHTTRTGIRQCRPAARSPPASPLVAEPPPPPAACRPRGACMMHCSLRLLKMI